MSDTDAVVVVDETPQAEQPLDVFKKVMLHPKAFFAAMPLDGQLKQPVVFLAIVLSIGALGVLLSKGITAYFPALIGAATSD